MKQFMKSLLLMMMISPLASLGMEPHPDRIELGKELAAASDRHEWSTVENLIAQGADLNQRDECEWTPLMNAAGAGQEKITKLLIDSQANLNLQRSTGASALMIAINNREEKIVQILIDAHADLHLRLTNGETALMIAAARGGSRGLCHMLIDAMLKQNRDQKERIYALLLCLKRVPGFRNTNQARHLFKPILFPTLTDVCQEINRIRVEDVRNQLLEKYGFQPISNSEAQ